MDLLAQLDWDKHGLPGLVIASLIGILVFALKWWTSYLERKDKQHLAEREKVYEEHKSERAESRGDLNKVLAAHRDERSQWKEEAQQREQRIESVTNQLTDAIQKLAPGGENNNSG